jgi:hypothetical protein
MILQGDSLMNEIDLAYIAGLVDGEAYIGIKKAAVRPDSQNPGYHARIQNRMVDEEAIQFISETLGGSYYKEKPSVAKGRPLFCYQSSDKSTEDILLALLPYLRVKKRQAETVMELRKLQADSTKHRTKVTGYRKFPNNHGTVRMVPNKSYSDEYVQMCETLWLRCKELNRVGVNEG